METPEALQQRVRREQQLLTRLRLAMTRLADAERERIWAIVAAKEAGLSIRQIARGTGVSPTRIHQLLHTDEARGISVWLSQLHDPVSPPRSSSNFGDQLVSTCASSSRPRIMKSSKCSQLSKTI